MSLSTYWNPDLEMAWGMLEEKVGNHEQNAPAIGILTYDLIFHGSQRG